MIVIKCYFTIFLRFFFVLNTFVVPYNVLRGSCARSFLFFFLVLYLSLILYNDPVWDQCYDFITLCNPTNS